MLQPDVQRWADVWQAREQLEYAMRVVHEDVVCNSTARTLNTK